MTRTLFGLVAAILLLQIGCIRSVNPVYRTQDVIFDPALAGVWAEAEKSDEWWEIQPLEAEKAYLLTYHESEDRSSLMRATLARRDGVTFLDLYPVPKEQQNAPYGEFLWAPVHTFAVVEQTDPEIVIRQMDPDWLGKLLENHPDLLAHAPLEDQYLLTASTEDLQAFIRQHLETPEAWSDKIVLRRKGAATQPTTAPATEP